MRRRAVALVMGLAVCAAVGAILFRRGDESVQRSSITADSIVLLGDSITEQGDWATLLPEHRISNAGYAGFTTEQLVPIADDVGRRRPAAVFVLTGTNDIRDRLPPSATADGLRRIVEAIRRSSPATRIVVQTVLPRADAVGAVAAVNAEIAAVATQLEVELLSLHEFDDGTGGLRTDETTDGVHLDEAGYERWAAILDDAIG